MVGDLSISCHYSKTLFCVLSNLGGVLLHDMKSLYLEQINEPRFMSSYNVPGSVLSKLQDSPEHITVFCVGEGFLTFSRIDGICKWKGKI